MRWHTFSQCSDELCKKSVRRQRIILPFETNLFIETLQFLKWHKRIICINSWCMFVNASRITTGDPFHKIIKYLYRFDQYSINSAHCISDWLDMGVFIFQETSYPVIKYFDRIHALINFGLMALFGIFACDLVDWLPNFLEFYHELLLIGVICLS